MYLCLIVGKNGAATGFTFCCATGIESFVRDYSNYAIQSMPMEVTIYPYRRKWTPLFSRTSIFPMTPLSCQNTSTFVGVDIGSGLSIAVVILTAWSLALTIYLPCVPTRAPMHLRPSPTKAQRHVLGTSRRHREIAASNPQDHREQQRSSLPANRSSGFPRCSRQSFFVRGFPFP